MYKEFFQDSEFLSFPLFTLFLFIAVFAYVVLRAFTRKPGDARIEALSRLPLDDGPPRTGAVRGNATR